MLKWDFREKLRISKSIFSWNKINICRYNGPFFLKKKKKIWCWKLFQICYYGIQFKGKKVFYVLHPRRKKLVDLQQIINSINKTKIVSTYKILVAMFLLSSIYIRKKYWIRENFLLPVFDGFTCFEVSWTRFDHY